MGPRVGLNVVARRKIC